MKSIALVGLLLVALVGGGYLLFFADQTAAEPTTTEGPGLAGPPKTDAQGGELGRPMGRDETATERHPEPVRVRRPEPERSYSQGLQGQVVSSVGGTLKDAEVFLLYGVAAQDMIAQLAMFGAGGRARARVAARTKTGGAGEFKLGAPPTEGPAPFELRIRADGHVVYQRQLRILANKWEKLGLVKLEKGNALRGIVRDKMTRLPIAEATIRVKVPNANFLVPTPGMEEGIETRSDASGRYVLEGLPSGPMEVVAFARGFGTYTRSDIVFDDATAQKTEDIDLPKGYAIEGWVTDGQGNVIPKARVEAVPFSQNSPAGHAYTDRDGHYAVFGLAEGEYIVSAQSPGYVRNERKPIKAGSKEVQIVLETQGAIRVRVLSKAGHPLSRYRLELKRFFPENPEHHGRTDIAPVEVRSAKNGEYVLPGVNPDNYVLQVEAAQFAKTYSKSFAIAQGQSEPVLVEVRMNEGGTLEGVVTDQQGKPVKGASVATLEDSYQDNPLMQMFRPLMSVKVTERSVVTDAKGRFRIKLLTPAKYQLRIDHPDFTRVYKKGFEVADGQRVDVGLLRLKQGGRVAGIVYGEDGRPLVGAKITVSSHSGEGATPILEQVFSDEKGEFRIARPLPEGKYEVQAARTDHANPLMQLADIQNSRTEIVVRRGMGKVVVRIRKK